MDINRSNKSDMPSLMTLALEAFGKYITKVTEKLIMLPPDSTVENFTVEYCRYLEETIRMIPPQLANEVSQALMLRLMRFYGQLDEKSYTMKYRRDKEKKFQNMTLDTVAKISSAVLHPCITKFRFSRAHFVLYDVNFQMACVQNKFLGIVLKKLDMIRSLRLEVRKFDAQIVIEGFNSMKLLEELTFWGCSDDIIEALSHSCKNLKKLEVRNSPDVTDKSAEAIRSFRQLKHLDIMRTRITSEGVSHIMSGELDLKVFKAELSSRQVEILSTSFPNLCVIHVRFLENCNLSAWKNLQHLNYLYLSGIGETSSCYEELLRLIGKQLTHLKLNDLHNLNLRFIAENCTSLQYIGLQLMYSESSVTFRRNHFANFPSIETCEIEIFKSDFAKQILTCFVNVKKVYLTGLMEPFDSLITYLLRRMIKDGIELYFFGNRLQISGDNLIVSKPNGSWFIRDVVDFKSVMKDIIY